MRLTTGNSVRGRSVDQLAENTKIPLKIRLIKHNSHTSGDSSEGGFAGILRVHNRSKRAIRGICLYFISRIVVVTMLWPYFSYAAAFPIISLPIIESQNVDSETSGSINESEVLCSQNVDVLTPQVNNNQVDGAIGGGRVLVVDDTALSPEMGSIGTTLDINQTQNNGKISVYEVREGDTLSQIAEMFDVSVNTIRWANDFSGPIKPGQVLVILPVSGITHKVKSGGTITDIAKIYKADVKEIALFNGIDVDTQLKPGDEIIVPNVDPINTNKDSGVSKKSRTLGANYQAAPSGYYINPVPTAIFTQNLHGYNSVDLGAPTGTPVYAAAGGKVIDSRYGGWNGGYALMIIISHDNGTQTLYAHLSENLTKIGQKVKQGEIIGYVGSTGNSTGPHLHFEVRGAKNPLSVCKVGAVCSI